MIRRPPTIFFFSIVFAFAGDSTITTLFDILYSVLRIIPKSKGQINLYLQTISKAICKNSFKSAKFRLKFNIIFLNSDVNQE